MSILYDMDISLDESLMRQCKKYGIHPRAFMITALYSELHTKAVTEQATRTKNGDMCIIG